MKGAAPSIINTGTFEKTEGTRTTEVAVDFANYGVIAQHTGILKITYPISAEGNTQFGGSENPSVVDHTRSECGDPVTCATGNFSETQTDLAVGGRGVGLDLTRSYNSQAGAAGEHGPFGYGWTSSFSDHVVAEKEAKSVVVHQANGSTVPFSESEGKLLAPAWTQDTLSGSSEAGYTLTFPNQTKYKFAASTGRLESITDRNGNATTLSYGTGGRLESIADSFGRKLTLAYNGEGLIESAKDPMGHTVKYTYEGGNLTSVTEPGEASPRWQFKYDGSHQITEMIDGRGGKTINEYNGAHQVTSQTDPMKRTLSFEYEPFETTITDKASGAVTLERFTSNDEPFEITRAYGTSEATTKSYTYNEGGYVTSETDGNGHGTKYGYDSEGNRTSMLNPDKDETKWTYDAKHDVETETTPEGETTTIERDAHGNALKVSRPAPGATTQVTKYKYDAHGDVESMIDPLSHEYKYEYDGYGDRSAETDPEGDKRTWEYNEDSQLTGMVSPRGHVAGAKESNFKTKYERDAQGRVITLINPLKHEAKYTYDADGDLETAINLKATRRSTPTTPTTSRPRSKNPTKPSPKPNTTQKARSLRRSMATNTQPNTNATCSARSAKKPTP